MGSAIRKPVARAEAGTQPDSGLLPSPRTKAHGGGPSLPAWRAEATRVLSLLPVNFSNPRTPLVLPAFPPDSTPPKVSAGDRHNIHSGPWRASGRERRIACPPVRLEG